MSKKTYRVRNWKEYNEALELRGSLTIWISEEVIKSWQSQERTGHRGRPLKYTDLAIECGLTVKAIFHLPFRATEGFLRSVMELLKLKMPVPDYSLLCKRQKGLKLSFKKNVGREGEPLHLLVDSTGLKVYGEGEWKVRQHGWCKHRLWRKLHVGWNAQTQRIESSELTDLGTQDCEGLVGVLEQVNGKIARITADGAYDRFSCYEQAERYHCQLIAPPQRNACTSAERSENKKKASLGAVKKRDEAVEQIRQLGRADWKVQNGYHRRSLAETGVFRIKHLLGSRLTAKNFEHQQVEVAIWCQAINTMTALGMPISMAID
jgi:hypothetical protein